MPFLQGKGYVVGHIHLCLCIDETPHTIASRATITFLKILLILSMFYKKDELLQARLFLTCKNLIP